MKKLTFKNYYKHQSLVMAMASLTGLSSLTGFAQKPNQLNTQKPASVLMGYYPANYQMAGTTTDGKQSVLQVKNQFMGLGNTLCVWVSGNYQGQLNKAETTGTNPIGEAQAEGKVPALGFTATLTNDSNFTQTISQITMQYYAAQKATALYIPMPNEAILYNAYQLHIAQNGKKLTTINKLYLVPSFDTPKLAATNGKINISNITELKGGQAPFQYYWMEYSQGGAKIVSNGRVDELSKLPTIATEDKDATYSLTIKDANYLVSNQYISTKASKNASKNTLGMQVSLYPNPTTSELYIQFDSSLRGTKQSLTGDTKNGQLSTDNYQLTYSITDLQGKELLKGNLNTADLKTISVQSLAQGTYMLTISNGKNQENMYQNKFVKL